MALTYPEIDPIAIEIGPVAIRWYALAYLSGLLIGWKYVARLAEKYAITTAEKVDDFLFWATLGVVLGGRLGYVLFYKPAFYFANPAEIPMVWHGGMAFHGGLLGVVVAVVWFARKNAIPVLSLGDLTASAAPIGLFFGRIANFINGELFGRVAPDAPLAMVFPDGGPLPRHPSQLYEGFLEGLVLFIVLAFAWRSEKVRSHPGTIFGIFLIGYGLSRFTVEFFRQPDAHLGYLYGGWLTMGQILSTPMMAAGLLLVVYALRRPAAQSSKAA